MPVNRSSKLRPYLRPPVLGAAFGLLLVLGSIAASTHGLLAFFSLEGLLIVVGGVIAVAFMSYDADEVRKALNAIADMYKEPKATQENLPQDIKSIASWARIIKEKGMRRLESSLGQDGIDDPFIKYGLNMVVSEYTPDDVKTMMETAADACYERENTPVDILEAMTSHAPAFGMVGTLVGMVAMLCRLNADNTATIGASLSVAFLATLYGVISARMVYMPAAAKLRQKVVRHRFRNQLIIEGMVMLAGGEPLAPEPKGDRITTLEINSGAFFDRGSATLSDSGKVILHDVAARLKDDQYKDYVITVEGHTDDAPISTTAFPSNWELSTARASAVVHYFLEQNIPAQKLRAAGYADTFPKAPNRDASGQPLPANQAQNRRVVIKLEKIDKVG